jgi:uncharacterized repeat protein (TIGR03987 family)
MSPSLIAAITAISAALALYTIGVFGERRRGTLGRRDVILFWCGLVCDTTGTSIMTMIAQSGSATGSSLHAISGVLAIVLMLVHAVWATLVIVRDDERGRAGFHRFSIVVWLFWLAPYVIGLLLGIPSIGASDVVATVVAVGSVACVAGLIWLGDHRQGTSQRGARS